MTESTLTRSLLDHLRQKVLGVVLKHSDQFTAGIPDVSITTFGRTVWLEIKLLKVARPPHCPQVYLPAYRKQFSSPQLMMMDKLGRHGLALYLIVLQHGKEGLWTLWKPFRVLQAIGSSQPTPLMYTNPMDARRDFSLGVVACVGDLGPEVLHTILKNLQGEPYEPKA